jgi:peptidylprolyl isomerase
MTRWHFLVVFLAISPGLALAQGGRDFSAPPDLTSPPADAAKTASGLISRTVTAGTGSEKPAATDVVTVNYTGWSSDGRMFDSSYARNKPSTFPLDRSLPGWR